MKRLTLLLPALLLAACTTKSKYDALAHADSLRADSIVTIKNEMLDEVMQSTQFLNDINAEIAKLKVQPQRKLSASLTRESELTAMRDERAAVTERIRELVARLDSSEARLASLRTRAATLSTRDAQLTAQVAQYERTIADLRTSVETQRTEFQTIVDRQNSQIASLNLKIDTVTRANVQLQGERATLTAQKTALTDTVGQLVTEKNTAYYVIGTRDELVKKGVLVEEGRRSLLLVGSRPVAPARELDPADFTRIDRLRDRQIELPAGDYSILSRHSQAFVTPGANHDGRLAVSVRIDDPVKFWEPSPFLVLVKK
jgi:predicted  nucleic acid-binding Zn-ribbon protein